MRKERRYQRLRVSSKPGNLLAEALRAPPPERRHARLQRFKLLALVAETAAEHGEPPRRVRAVPQVEARHIVTFIVVAVRPQPMAGSECEGGCEGKLLAG